MSDWFISTDKQLSSHFPIGQMDIFEGKTRPSGIRWRDDEELIRIAYGYHHFPFANDRRTPITVRPLITENRAISNQWVANAEANHEEEPSLEDIDLIDALWRHDIDTEKGANAGVFGASEQYERDLHMLTEKSFNTPLSVEENWQFENLSKYLYEDFYPSYGAYGKSTHDDHGEHYAASPTHATNASNHFYSSDQAGEEERLRQSKREQLHTPTDEELDALLEDMRKGGELEVLSQRDNPLLNVSFDQPVMNNVSLADARGYNSSNMTDSLFNTGFYMPTPVGFVNASIDENANAAGNATAFAHWFQQPMQDAASSGLFEDQTVPSPSSSSSDATDFFVGGLMNLGMQKMSVDASSSHMPNQPSSSFSTVASSDEHNYAQWFSMPSSSSSSSPDGSSSNFSSPDLTESGSRVVGKLVPAIAHTASEDDEDDEEEDDHEQDTMRAHGTTRLRSTPTTMNSRRRGRQSKDEQLAASNGLPVSAAQIACMSLTELQRLMRDERLGDAQRALIRKIRRRGKNKVAARTCRLRRGASMAMLETETSLLAQERQMEAGRHARLTNAVQREVDLINALERELDL